MAWAKRTIKTYVGNAAAVRDYRAQLRGNRALWLWTSYLGLLILLAGLFYSSMADDTYSQSISQVQGSLTEFYSMIIGLLAAVICLVAPALTASTITAERQRKSLDLIFSAPVPPRYLLVGKMLASFRYLIMLLVLALPVTAVCVVMGGATWGDVIGSYIVLLSNGIVLMAMGLAVSAQATTLMSAIANTYGLVIMYLWTTGFLFGTSALGSAGPGSFLGAAEAPWTLVLFPFTASLSAPTYTLLYGLEIPNFAFGLIFAIALSKLLIAGAGSSLSHFGSSETKGFRVHALIFGAVFAALLILPVGTSPLFSMFGSAISMAPASSSMTDFSTGLIVAVMCSALAFATPQITCHSLEADRKYRNDGAFSVRQMLTGTPSGGLPFLLAMAGAIVAGGLVSMTLAGTSMPGIDFWSLSAWGTGFLVFWWGFARFVSGFDLNLKSARTYVIAAGLTLICLPLPVLSILSFSSGDPGSSAIWAVHMMYPWSPGTAYLGIPYALMFTVVGLTLALAGERNYASRLRTPRRGSNIAE